MSATAGIAAILCLFQGRPSEMPALNLAFCLARDHRANLRILHITRPVMSAIDPFGVGAYAGSLTSPALVDQFVKDDDDLIAAARRQVGDCARAHGVSLCSDEGELAVANPPAALFVVENGYPEHVIGIYGKLCDIAVTARQDATGFNDESTCLPVLFECHKALILCPSASRPGIAGSFAAKRVAMAWDGSQQASLALERAVPLLANATSVFLLTVREGKTPAQTARSNAVAFLKAHHLEPTVMELEAPNQNVGLALLNASKELKVDLLIMGAFGHSRMTERLLGGASRYMLGHADVPVLMVH